MKDQPKPYMVGDNAMEWRVLVYATSSARAKNLGFRAAQGLGDNVDWLRMRSRVLPMTDFLLSLAPGPGEERVVVDPPGCEACGEWSAYGPDACECEEGARRGMVPGRPKVVEGCEA